MPFVSDAQRRFMWANYPQIARRWEKHTPNKDLPEKKKTDKKEQKSTETEKKKENLKEQKREEIKEKLAAWLDGFCDTFEKLCENNGKDANAVAKLVLEKEAQGGTIKSIADTFGSILSPVATILSPVMSTAWWLLPALFTAPLVIGYAGGAALANYKNKTNVDIDEIRKIELANEYEEALDELKTYINKRKKRKSIV